MSARGPPGGGSEIVIPIEISTKDRADIQRMIRELKELNKQAGGARNRIAAGRRRGGGSGAPAPGGATPVPWQGDADGSAPAGPIFGGSGSGGPALPARPRDRTSKQALQRNSAFTQVAKDVDYLKAANEQIHKRLGNASTILGIASNGPHGALLGLATRLVPILGALFVAKGVFDQLIQYIFRQGGPWDRRFRYIISEQFFSLTSREEAKRISEGYGTLRVTTRHSLRGPTTQINNPQQRAKLGTPILADDLSSLAAGVTP